MSKKLPETQRASRIIEIIYRISSQPKYWTRANLAASFEVSERQITKDLQVIRHGLVFDLRHAHGGGYYFEKVPKLPALNYTISEALAILLAAQAGRRLVGIPQDDLSAAIGRLTSLMPQEFRPLLTSSAMLPAPPVNDKHRESMLSQLYHAIAASQSVDIEYLPASRPDEMTRRRFDPYAVLPTGRTWHAVGWCHLRGDVRIFKVDRIRTIKLTQAEFERDPEFDFEEFLTAGWGITRVSDQPPENIELIFNGQSARWVAEENWHPTQSMEWVDEDRLRFCIHVPVTEEFCRWVLGYGAYCEVVRPESLQHWIREQAEALIELAS